MECRHHLWRWDVSALQTIFSIYPLNHQRKSKHIAMAGKSTGRDLTLTWAQSKQNPLTSHLSFCSFGNGGVRTPRLGARQPGRFVQKRN